MENKAISIQSYVESKALRRGISAVCVVSLLVAAASLTAAIAIQLHLDRTILSGISRSLASLIAIEDRPEVNRLLKSVANERESKLRVIKNGILYGTSDELDNLDRKNLPPSRIFRLSDASLLDLVNGALVTAVEIKPFTDSAESASVSIATPASRVLWIALYATLGATLFAVFLGYVFTSYAAKSARHALKPVGELAQAISRFVKDEELFHIPATSVTELEMIRTAIENTHQNLTIAREALASSKARAIAGEIYGSVLHDLNGLSLSMRRVTHVIQDSQASDAERMECVGVAARISEDIVRTIESGKALLKGSDPAFVLAPIQQSISEITAAHFSGADSRATTVTLPTKPVLVAHDPILLQRAVGNLLSNAHRHARSEVRLSVVTSDSGVSIRVDDDGPGIPQASLGKYLKGKGQSSHDNRPAMGLLSTHHIVRTHGAKLVYRTSELGGALFEIRFPKEASPL